MDGLKCQFRWSIPVFSHALRRQEPVIPSPSSRPTRTDPKAHSHKKKGKRKRNDLIRTPLFNCAITLHGHCHTKKTNELVTIGLTHAFDISFKYSTACLSFSTRSSMMDFLMFSLPNGHAELLDQMYGMIFYNRYYLSGCQVCQQDRLRWNSKLYYLRGHHLTFLNNTENWNQYQTHYTISPIVPPSYKRRQFSNQSLAIILYTCPLPKSFFLCTSFALQIKQTPILAGAIILHTMKKPTHMFGCLEARWESLEKNTLRPINNRRDTDGWRHCWVM